MCVCVHVCVCVYVSMWMCLYVDCCISSTSMKVPLINKSADGDDSVEHVTIQEETGGTNL